jgi:hypothetical protein
VFCCGFDLPHRVVVVADELDVFLSGVEAEGSNIPAAVPMEKLTPQAPEAAEVAPEPMQEVTEEAAAATGGGRPPYHQRLLWRWLSALRRSRTQSPSALRR